MFCEGYTEVIRTVSSSRRSGLRGSVSPYEWVCIRVRLVSRCWSLLLLELWLIILLLLVLEFLIRSQGRSHGRGGGRGGGWRRSVIDRVPALVLVLLFVLCHEHPKFLRGAQYSGQAAPEWAQVVCPCYLFGGHEGGASLVEVRHDMRPENA